MCTVILRSPSECDQKETSQKKRRRISLFLLHDNAPAHRSVLAKDFLAKTNVTTLELPHNLLTWLQLILICFFD